MKKPFILVVFTTILTSGCMQQSVKPVTLTKDVSDAQRSQDYAYCEGQSMNINAADWEYRGTFMEGVNIKNKQRKQFTLCLRGKGYN